MSFEPEFTQMPLAFSSRDNALRTPHRRDGLGGPNAVPHPDAAGLRERDHRRHGDRLLHQRHPHLIAMARRAGHALTLDDFERFTHVPVIGQAWNGRAGPE